MATIKAFIRTSTKTDKANVRFRLSAGRGLQLFHKSEIEIEPEKWDADKEQMRARIICHQSERTYLNDAVNERKRLIIALYDAELNKDTLTSDWLNEAIDKALNPQKYETPTIQKGFFDVYDYFLSTQSFSIGRKRHFNVTKRALQHFEQYKAKVYSPVVLDLDTITADTLRDFETYLKNEHKVFVEYPEIYSNPKSREPEPKGKNTLNGIFSRLRTFFLWAIDNEFTTNNPFRKFDMPQAIYGTPIYISMGERKQLYNTVIESKALVVQRDIFVFQCLIGCRVGDLLSLTKANVVNGVLEYVPEKTKKEKPVTIRVPLNPTAKEILEKYKDIEGDTLLPFISDQKYNVAIKEVFALSGLTRPVTILNPVTGKEEKKPLNMVASSHMARRTFIGNLYKQVKDPNLVGSLSGHKEGSRAFARYREIDDEIKTELVNLLD